VTPGACGGDAYPSRAVHPRVQRKIHAIIRESGFAPRRALEVGGVMGPDSLLGSPQLAGADRYCLNLVEMASSDGITAVQGNANDMSAFDDEAFDLVVSNATLEHDRRFWLSLGEMRRVLAPGGMLIIGAPGYRKNPERDHGLSTHTYRVHYSHDYYRFSEQAFRDVFFEGMEDVAVQAILAPPRIIGIGFKPGEPLEADRAAAATALMRLPKKRRPEQGRIRRLLGRR
jgi:SAM-dependent methyltransferase